MTSAKKTAKKNAEFKRMSMAEARVAIAKDALSWVREGALVPTSGTYVSTVEGRKPLWQEFHLYDSDAPKFENVQARDVNIGPCRVCAKGALLCAKAVRFNHVTARQLAEYSNKYLKPYFSDRQLDEIEGCFEATDEGWDPPEHAEWAYKFPDYDDRLRAILRNIIRNKGDFKVGEVR